MVGLLWPTGAAAQEQCNARDDILELLAKKYGEARIAAGVSNTGGLVEVLTNFESGAWTIIVSKPNGISCMVAAGEGWRSFEPVKPIEGERS